MYVFTCFICKNSRSFLRAKIRKKQQTERPCPKKQHFVSTNALYGINLGEECLPCIIYAFNIPHTFIHKKV